LHDDLHALVRGLPTNVVARFAGYSTQNDLFAFYADRPVDVFANVSESEGTAVSIMEAIACGIPILATAVGGNTEIVTRDNGVLVGPEADPREIGSKLLSFVDEPQEARRYREGSRRVWHEYYDAETNFGNFAKRLATISGVMRDRTPS
jgi:glycosyltransferase involved in cell wall biosynthesis